MKNIHLKNLNEEKMLKELTKNPKSYLNYIFSQSANEIYSTSHEFKKLPIIKKNFKTLFKMNYTNVQKNN